MAEIERLAVRLSADIDDESEARVTWYTVRHAKGGLVPWRQVQDLIVERDAALARVEELESHEGKHLWVHYKAALNAGTAHGYVPPCSFSVWLESRLKRLAELEAEDRLVDELKADLERARRRGEQWEARVNELDREFVKEVQKEVARRVGAFSGAEPKLRELSAIRKDAIAHGFPEGGDLPAWLDKKLTDLDGVRDRLAERLLPIAQDRGYRPNDGELGAWVEAVLRAWGERGELRALTVAQRYRDADPGPAGESLEQWLEGKLSRLQDVQRAHDSLTATLNAIIAASSERGRPSYESVVAWMKNLAATKESLLAERDYLQKVARSWGWTNSNKLAEWLHDRLRERTAYESRLSIIRREALVDGEREGEETSTSF